MSRSFTNADSNWRMRPPRTILQLEDDSLFTSQEEHFPALGTDHCLSVPRGRRIVKGYKVFSLRNVTSMISSHGLAEEDALSTRYANDSWYLIYHDLLS